MKARAGPIQPVVLVGGNPALHEEPIENHDQLFRRVRWTAGDRVRLGIGPRVRLGGVDNFDHDPLDWHDMFHNPPTAVQSHRIVRTKRDGVSCIEPLKHLTKQARVAARSFRPQSTPGSEEWTDLGLDELVRLGGDSKATVIANWGQHA